MSGMREIRARARSTTALAALTALTQIVVAVVVVFCYSWTLGLLFLAFAPLYAGLMRYAQTHLRPVFDSIGRGLRSAIESRQIDAIRGIETVKALGAEEGLRRRMAGEFRELRDKLLPRRSGGDEVYEALVSTRHAALVYALFLVVGALRGTARTICRSARWSSISGLVLIVNGSDHPAAGPVGSSAAGDRIAGPPAGRVRAGARAGPRPIRPAAPSRRSKVTNSAARASASPRTRPISPIARAAISRSMWRAGMAVALVGRSGLGPSALVRAWRDCWFPPRGLWSTTAATCAS